MVLYRIYSQEHRIRYFSDLCSTAVLFQVICLLATFVPPLFTGYFTSGFYYKELTYSEQPQITFNQVYRVTLDSFGSTQFSSSELRLDAYFQTIFIASYLRSSLARDTNGDALADQLEIDIDILSSASIAGQTLKLYLLFNYALSQYPAINMTALGYINVKVPPNLPLGTSSLTIYGQFAFQQRQPIPSYENDTSLQNPIFNDNNLSGVASLDDSVATYLTRTYYATFGTQYVQWSSISTGTTTSTLHVRVIVNNGLQVIRFIPSFWREFRWAWIQYCAGLLPFFYVVNKVKEFVFSNGLVRAVVVKSP